MEKYNLIFLGLETTFVIQVIFTCCSMASDVLSESIWSPVTCCFSSCTNDLYCANSISFAASMAWNDENLDSLLQLLHIKHHIAMHSNC